MNESYDQEINLKWLCYRILRAWRGIVIWAVIIGLVVSVVYITFGLYQISDPEYIKEAKLSFQREYDSWAATGTNLQMEITNLENARATQQEYNNKSVLMQINPLRTCNASIELYMDYDYQIMPGMTYQNTDLTERILKSYETYMTNGEMYRYVIDNLGYELELNYLQEILSAEVDYETSMISVHVCHTTADKCQEIINLSRTGLDEKCAQLSQNIGEHELTLTNATDYETVDLNLETLQQTNIQHVSELDILLQEKALEYKAWIKTSEPTPEYTTREVIKSGIKNLLLGGIAGGVLAVAVVMSHCLLSGKLLNPDDIRSRFDLRPIGALPAQRQKKPFAFVSRWFAAFGGITVRPEDYEGLARMIGTSIRSELSADPATASWRNLAFTGTLPQEQLVAIVADLGLDKEYTTICATNILTNASSIEQVMEADAVIIVEQQERSFTTDIEREIEALHAWKKHIVGVIVTNVDAVM